MNENQDIKSQATDSIRRSVQPLWKSKSLAVAALMMVGGLALWPSHKSDPAPHPPAAATPAGSSSLAESPDNHPTQTKANDSKTGARSPALFRFGASYIVGYFGGFFLRRFFKISMLVAGVILAGIAGLKALGILNLDWAGIEGHVSDSFSWVRGHSAGLRQFLIGYVPSSLAAVVGLFMGARRG